MPTTISIPLTTLVAGVDIQTPSQPVGSFTAYQFSINRKVGAVPLDSLSGPVIEMHVDWSFDGGATWPNSDSQTINGGVIPIGKGNNAESLVTAWGSTFLSAATHVRARVHPVQAVTVSGSLVLSP
jgi:hypothetical protein